MTTLKKMGQDCPGIEKVFNEFKAAMIESGAEFELTIEEFHSVWKRNDNWALRGKRPKELGMARKSVKKPYAKGNVVIKANKLNKEYVPPLKSMEKRNDGSYYFWTVTPKGTFSSLRDAGEAHGMTAMAILKKLNNSELKSFYKKYANGEIDYGTETRRKYTGDRKATMALKVFTPEGEFESASDAAKAENISQATMMRRIKDKDNTKYYRAESERQAA